MKFYPQFDVEVLPELSWMLSRKNIVRFSFKTLLAAAYVLLNVNISDKRQTEFFKSAYLVSLSLRRLLESDLVISCGGGFLNDSWGSGFVINLLPLFVAKLFRKKVMICAQSIGPFRIWINKMIVRIVLSLVDVISLRDKGSFKYILDNLKIAKTKLQLTADLAFLHYPVNISTINRSKLTNLKIGVSVRHWIYPGVKNYRSAESQYKRAMASFLDYLIEKFDAEIIFLPMSTIPNQYFDSDDVTSEEIIQLISRKNRARIAHLGSGVDYLMTILSNLDYIVTTRMHLLIFAAMNRIPTIAIMYEPKTEFLAEMLGIKEFVIRIDEVSAEKLIEKWHQLLAIREKITIQLREGAEVMKNMAEKNAQIIKNMLSCTE
jgi:colanic acid/amylovoran biosynthesis protein